MADFLENLGATPDTVERVTAALELVGVHRTTFLKCVKPSCVARLVPSHVADQIDHTPVSDASVRRAAELLEVICGEVDGQRPYFPGAGLDLPPVEYDADNADVGGAEEAASLRGMSIAGSLAEIARRVHADPFFSTRHGRAYVLTWLRVLHPSIGIYDNGVFTTPLVGAFQSPTSGPWSTVASSHAVESQLNPIMIFTQTPYPLFTAADGAIVHRMCSEDDMTVVRPGVISWVVAEENVVPYLLQLRFIALEASTRLGSFTLTREITPQRQASYDNDTRILRSTIARLWQGDRRALRNLPPCMFPHFEQFLFNNDMPALHGRTMIVYALVHAGVADRRDVVARIERVCASTERFVRRNAVATEQRSMLRFLSRRHQAGRTMLGCALMQTASLCGTTGIASSVPNRVYSPQGSTVRDRLVADIEDLPDDPCARCAHVVTCASGTARRAPIRHPLQFITHMASTDAH